MFEYDVVWWLRPLLCFIDAFFGVIFFWKKNTLPKNIKRILIIRIEHIGDVLLATPLFRALRRTYPDARIDVLVRSIASPVLARNNDVRAVVCNVPWLSEGGSWKGVFRVVSQLRKKPYDVVLEPHGDPRNIILASVVGTYRIGFANRGLGFLLDCSLPYDAQQHIIERNLTLARPLSVGDAGRELSLSLSQRDLVFARNLFKKHKIKDAVCLSPGVGAGRDEKLWTVEGWASLADSLSETGCDLIFNGGPSQKDLVGSILHQMKTEKYLNVCGTTTLLQSAAIIGKCNVLISIDSGPVHIARALGTPLVGLYGSHDPAMCGYTDERSISIWAKDIKALSPHTVMSAYTKLRRRLHGKIIDRHYDSRQ